MTQKGKIIWQHEGNGKYGAKMDNRVLRLIIPLRSIGSDDNSDAGLGSNVRLEVHGAGAPIVVFPQIAALNGLAAVVEQSVKSETSKVLEAIHSAAQRS